MKLLTSAQMAEILEVSERTFRKMRVPYYQVGKQKRFDASEVLASIKRVDAETDSKRASVRVGRYTKEEIEGLREIGMEI